MSTREEVDPRKLLIESTATQREGQIPLVFFSLMLALWVATWFGVFLLL